MFTGLVSETGRVGSTERADGGARFEVSAGLSSELAPGDSVAVSGVCLTVVRASDRAFEVETVTETLNRSTLGTVAEGDPVNLELPLRAADRLGGHIVQGHVDGVGSVASAVDEGLSRLVAIRADAEVCRYVVAKGSVALDGVSLTAARAAEDGFTVALIPETVERTTLGALDEGDSVNIEVDVLAKYVEKLAPRARPAEAVVSGGVR